ncbi:sensor domain-containing diguanylate cyclase [Xanthomonas campestris pv. campestris]|nr:sensor domain-containing diguanylate cyclase [Xanthomonas campestris pv. campestris]
MKQRHVAAPLAANETDRLARLALLRVVDSEAEPFFDALAAAAQAIAGTPIALVSLVDEHRQWWKANVGLPGVSQTPRELAFCAHAILDDAVMEVPNASDDPRFSGNELVTDAPGIRYYAGAPIVLSDGLRMGTVCVIDQRPRQLQPAQLEALRHLARVAAEGLEQRRLMLERAETNAQLQQRLRESEAFLERTGRVAGVGGWEVDVASGTLSWSDQTCRLHDLPPGYRPSLGEAIAFYPLDARAVITEAVEACVRDGTPWDLELPLISSTGRHLWVQSTGAMDMTDGRMRLIGAVQDVTDRHRAMDALATSERKFRKMFQYSLGLICTHDMDGRLISVNPAAARSLGRSVEDMEGRALVELVRPERHAALHGYLSRMVLDGQDSGVIELVAGDGSLRHWQYHNVLDVEADGTVVLAHAQDVTNQYKQEKQLLEWSFTDPLTNCQPPLSGRAGQARPQRALGLHRGGPGQVQAGQRHPRPPARRRSAGADGLVPQPAAAHPGPPGTAGRRRVFGAAASAHTCAAERAGARLSGRGGRCADPLHPGQRAAPGRRSTGGGGRPCRQVVVRTAALPPRQQPHRPALTA